MAFEFDDACFRADRIAQIGIAPTRVEFGDVAFGVQCVVDELRLAVVVDVVVQISEAVFLIFRRHETEHQSLIKTAVFPIGIAPAAVFVAVCLGVIEVGHAVHLCPACLRGNGVVKTFAVKAAVCLQRTEGLVYVFGNKVMIAAVGAVELVFGEIALCGGRRNRFGRGEGFDRLDFVRVCQGSAKIGADARPPISSQARCFCFISHPDNNFLFIMLLKVMQVKKSFFQPAEGNFY